MSVTVKHPFVSAVADSADTSLVRPSNWNADHTIIGLGTAAEKDVGVANGVASLDSGGKVPVSELPAAVLGALSYQGTWNASTNTPTLASGVGTKGYYYVVSVAGSTNLDGVTDWLIGDWAVYNGTAWQKVDNTDTVTSVNGQTGTVVLTTTDIAEGTNEYFTTARARASVSAGTGISYDSGTGVITNSAPDQTVVLTAGTGISTSGTYPSFTVTNTAPDQTVALTGAGTTVVTGTYPNFTITSNDSTTGTVTSVAASAGTGISVSGSPITTSGTLTITNTAPDQTVVLTAGTGISTSGTYPNFTITNTAPSGGGDVVGPTGATDNAVARYDTTTGKLLQNSLVIIDDTGSVTGVNSLTAQSLTVNNNSTLGFSNTDTLDVRARITSDLEPNTNNAKDIGTNGRNWRDGFFGRNLDTVNLAYSGTLTGGTGVIAIGTNQIYKDASGNVGIGTASPATDLDVVGPAGVTSFTGTTKLGVAVRGSTAANDYSGIDFYGNSQTNPTARIGVITTGSGSSLTFGTSNSYASGITTAGMTINDDGIVGVGTTNPTDNVGFQAAIDVSSTVGGAIYFRDSDLPAAHTYVGYIGSNSTTYVWTTANGPILFGTQDAERMRVAATGAVSIGKSVATVTGAGLVNDPSGLIRVTRAGTTSQTMIQFANNGGTQVGSISTSGSTTTYSTSSDYRLKENVSPMTGALAKVQALKPVTYTWKNDGLQGQGFIAHELQEIIPDCVTGVKDAIESINEVDAEGRSIGTKEVPVYQGVDTSFLVATLVAAIQEQQALISQLQADVATLKGN